MLTQLTFSLGILGSLGLGKEDRRRESKFVAQDVSGGDLGGGDLGGGDLGGGDLCSVVTGTGGRDGGGGDSGLISLQGGGDRGGPLLLCTQCFR